MLFGGLTVEREISVRAGEAVMDALRFLGHEAVAIFVDRDVDQVLRQSRIDAAILTARGRYSTDGCLQGILEFLAIPYTGSSVRTSALTRNRAHVRDLLRMANLPVAAGYVAHAEKEVTSYGQMHGTFGFPVVVRPVSAALLLPGEEVHDEAELESGLETVFRLDPQALVERFPAGPRYTVAVLNGVALGMAPAWHGERPNSGKAPSPASPILEPTPGRRESARRLALQAYDALSCEGPVSVEIVLSERMNETIVDMDTAPLLHPAWEFATIASQAGLEFPDLIEEILKGARLSIPGRLRNQRLVQSAFPGPDRRFSAVPQAH